MLKKFLISLLVVSALLSTLFFIYLSKGQKNLEVNFLDVGQGDSMFIKTPYGQNILIDGGPDKKVLKQLGKNLSFWDRKVDLMVLTHPHDDHVTGLIDVIKRYKVEKILYTGVVHDSPGYISWLKTVREKKIPVIIIDRRQKITLGENCYLDILYPEKRLSGEGVENLNNSSMTIKMIYGKTKFLFMGDIEKDVEEKLVREKIDLQANVLKVGHHGSETSSSEDFLSLVNPEVAVIEVGKDNQFGHPSRRVTNRLERAGIKVYRTDLDGMVRTVSDGNKVLLKD